MFLSKLIIVVLFLSSTIIVNKKCDEIHQTFHHKQMQKKIIQTINSIPTLEQNFNQIPDSDIIAMLDLVEHGMNWTKPTSYLRKMLSLSCAYGHVTLYILYHFIDMQSMGQSINDPFLDYYRECIRHMLQVLYLTDSFADRELWHLAITLDAFVRNKLVRSTFNFKGMADSLNGSLTQRCVPELLLNNFPVYERLAGWFDFVSYNRQLGSQLMLSKGHPLFMADLYHGDEQFEIYQFFWNDNKTYENFTPPKSWFKSYDDKRMRKAYEVVLQSWKSDFYSLQKYTDSARNLVLTVTYYALLLHCHYLQMTWYIVFERVKSVSLPSEQESMQNEAIALLRIPLSLVDNILQNVHYSEDMEYLKDITCNLTYDENADRTAFNKFVDRLLDRYNFYAKTFELEQIEDYSAMKVKFSVPNQMQMSALKTTLLNFNETLESYYETVKRALSPTNFRVIEYFTSTKPEMFNVETSQDPNLLIKNKTVTEFEQDLETRIYFFKILNKIPTLENSPLRVSDYELNALMYDANKNVSTKSRTSHCYEKKIRALICSYGHATLYMVYHINDLYINDKTDDEKNFYLLRYTKCAHRLMSVMNATKSFILRSVWIVVIVLDTLRHSKIDKHDGVLSKAMSNIMISMNKCHIDLFKNKLFQTYDDLVKKGPFDFAAYNDQLLSKLMLSDGNEGFMMNLYRGNERFDIYQFFWNINRDNKSFAPPASWFPEYNDKHLQTVYEDVAFNWKNTFYIIMRYKEAINNLVMMVTYYALLLFFYYLEITWSGITRQVKYNDFAVWVRFPLPLVKPIFCDLNLPEDDTSIVKIMENNFAISDITDRTAYHDFINRMLARYNFYTTQLDMKKINYLMIANEFSVPDQMEMSTLKNKLLEVFETLNAYYETVKRTLSPTTFNIIDCFTSTKPNFLNFETSQDPDQRCSSIVFKYFSKKERKMQKKEKAKHFYKNKF